ncbi:hypothetical protein B7463_g9366, partial [Scytalidium lignicola]
MALRKTPNYTLLSQGEEQTLTVDFRERRHARIWKWLVSGTFAVLVIIALIVNRSMGEVQLAMVPDNASSACPQYPALKHSDATLKVREEVMEVLDSGDFLERSVKNMQGAVQIPTESFDDMRPVGEDPRFDIFQQLHEYLEKTFPLVYSKLDDVVPVPEATLSRWTYPPYSGHYDGRYIWGRGSVDCKNVVIAILESFEVLLEKGYEPERTMLIAFGFDEEISGWQGAKFLAQHIQDTKGKDSLELIIDEGLGFNELYGTNFALPGLGEKGYLDVKIEVETAGGHSSIPPDHTAIGILSRIISTVEDNPYEPGLTPANPYFTTLQCGAEYGPDISPWLRKTIKASLKSPKSAKEVANYLAKEDIGKRYLMQTSQAVDIINGGVKINALPENVQAVIHHRIAFESRVSDIRTKYQSLIEKEILPKFPFALDAWGTVSGNTSSNSAGKIILSDFDQPLEPSPISPYDSHAYRIFTGTIKQIFGEDTIVAPSVMSGNTDTKFYWELTRNIYRFTPIKLDETMGNVHTVDEKSGMKEHVEAVRFYVQMIMNGDISK